MSKKKNITWNQQYFSQNLFERFLPVAEIFSSNHHFSPHLYHLIFSQQKGVLRKIYP